MRDNCKNLTRSCHARIKSMYVNWDPHPIPLTRRCQSLVLLDGLPPTLMTIPRSAHTYNVSKLLNKSFARILIRCPTLNEHKPFYLIQSTCMGILKFTFFRVRQTKGNLVRRQWIDVKFDVMGMQRIHVYV